MDSSTDRIERRVLIKGTVARVWRALSDAAEFGAWFGVDFKGKTFAPGKKVQGKISYPGYEHLTMEMLIERVIPERLLSFRWHPAAIDPMVDYSQEPTTLVVFELEEVEGGTMLSVAESGLDKIPLNRRAEVYRLNSSGWDAQVENVKKHVAET
ncbi:MAG: SRPBCC family protein [Pseudomonadota bacterium]|nr:SRPBCC family protein [Pseudomonadota bacterium]